MYKTGHAFTDLLLKESATNDVINVCLTTLLRTTQSTSGDVVCRHVSTLKADILNITYDCYPQNNNIETAELDI